MKIMTFMALLMAISLTSYGQKHKATKLEADYYNKYKALYASLPEKFRSATMTDFDTRPDDTREGDAMEDCKSIDCYMLLINAGYDFAYGNPAANSLRSQLEAIKGNDDASMKKKDPLQYKLDNEFGVTLKLMANYVSDAGFMYCKTAASHQVLAPPAGWDGWYMDTAESCPDFGGHSHTSLFFMGAAPTMKGSNKIDTDQGDWIKAIPTFPVNPADISQFKVKNIVMSIQGSKELVAEFLKNVDAKALRAMMQ